MYPEDTSEVGATPTYGERAVGLSFNPSWNRDVHEIKELFAQLIDKMDEVRKQAWHSEKGRLASVAITEAQGAQMWAVKAVTWED